MGYHALKLASYGKCHSYDYSSSHNSVLTDLREAVPLTSRKLLCLETMGGPRSMGSHRVGLQEDEFCLRPEVASAPAASDWTALADQDGPHPESPDRTTEDQCALCKAF